MNGLFFAIAGYFCYAMSGISDKFLLRQKATTKPMVFTFYVAVFSLFAFVLTPFGLGFPGARLFSLDILAGFLFFLSIFSFYACLDENEASRVMPLIGGLTPLLVLLFSWYFLGEIFTGRRLLAFFLLVLGSFLIIARKKKAGNYFKIFLAILANAVYLVFIKFVFEKQSFVDAFVWSRLGLVLTALALLIIPKWRKEIFSSTKQADAPLGGIFIFDKTVSGLGSFLIHLGIAKASVSLVNALQGTEYVFLFFFAWFLSKKFPKVLKESLNYKILLQKFSATLFICAGLVLLFL